MSDATTGPEHWFEPVAEHLGRAYLRYSFTKGTVQEVDFLVAALGLSPGSRVLDVGCGPGRHAHELARRGVPSTASTSARGSSRSPATTRRRGRRSSGSMPGRWPSTASSTPSSRCARARFGLMVGERRRTTPWPAPAWRRAVRPGGRLALSAFNAYFAVKYHDGRHVRRRPRRRPREHRGPRRAGRGARGRPVDRRATRPASCAC